MTDTKLYIVEICHNCLGSFVQGSNCLHFQFFHVREENKNLFALTVRRTMSTVIRVCLLANQFYLQFSSFKRSAFYSSHFVMNVKSLGAQKILCDAFRTYSPLAVSKAFLQLHKNGFLFSLSESEICRPSLHFYVTCPLMLKVIHILREGFVHHFVRSYNKCTFFRVERTL